MLSHFCFDTLRNENNNAFVIDGSTLAILMRSKQAVLIFTNICMQCVAVLCCRMSPAQKAEVYLNLSFFIYLIN